MLFNKKAEIDRSIDKSKATYEQPEVKKIMQENAEEVDWKDILALTIAGIQVLAPRTALFIASYVLVALLLLWFTT